MQERIGSPDVVVGFDIKTHDWLDGPPRKGSIGPFGWYRICDEMATEYSRIVQLGWATGGVHEAATIQTKCRFVKPNGFQVSAKSLASNHKETLKHDWLDLEAVLREFLAGRCARCLPARRALSGTPFGIRRWNHRLRIETLRADRFALRVASHCVQRLLHNESRARSLGTHRVRPRSGGPDCEALRRSGCYTAVVAV